MSWPNCKCILAFLILRCFVLGKGFCSLCRKQWGDILEQIVPEWPEIPEQGSDLPKQARRMCALFDPRKPVKGNICGTYLGCFLQVYSDCSDDIF